MSRQTELLPLSHNPARPVRSDVIGEVVFVEAWQRLMQTATFSIFMGDDTSKLDEILMHHRIKPPDQRAATVCASLMRWFGTNCGGGFLYNAKHLASSGAFRSREDAYLAAWALDHSRLNWLNGGVRTLESCMSTAAPVNGRHPPAELTADDYETAEHLVRWLGSNEGQRFIDLCEAEIAARLKIQACEKRLSLEVKP